jgi:enoyl-CoA hydratase/carnithine racemase
VTASEAVTHTIADRICQVSLHRPPANALGLALVTGLERALDAFEASTARVLVITSALDGFFAAGADIKLMGSFADAPNGSGLAEFAAYGERLRAPLSRLAASDRPSIAAIEGLALGGGLELALACTLRVGSRDARLGLPEAKLGLIPGAGGTQRLTRLVGRGRALDIMLTARDVPAEEAHALGLLDRLVEPGTAAAEATALARTLCTRSGAALTQIMRCVDDADELPLEQGLAREADRVNALFPGPEATEGLQAFLAKRRPNYV